MNSWTAEEQKAIDKIEEELRKLREAEKKNGG